MNKLANSPIYLDNQATTPVSVRVLETMMPYLTSQYGNPHSNDHWFGWQSKKAIELARKNVADFIHADADEIIFTSGATESNNIAILGSLNLLKSRGKKRIIISAFEHKCVLEAAHAAERQGFQITQLKPNADGFITPTVLLNAIDDNVGLVSIMMVNNEIGTIQPIEELSSITRSVGALFHTDAAQAGLFLEINVTKDYIDLLSLSSHKMYGPKGIGALFVRREIQEYMSSLVYGGGQENGLRSGTVPTMLCVGMGRACEIISNERTQNTEHLQRLSSTFWKLLLREHPTAIINGSSDRRHPGNLNIAFPNMDAHSLLQALQPNVAASSGSACSTGSPEPSHVLRSIGLPENLAESSIRFSFGLHNTEEEMARAVDYIVIALKNID